MLQNVICSGDHSESACGFFRNIPSPEQGASTRITSKKPGKKLKSLGSLLVIMQFDFPHFIMFSDKICARERIVSLEISKLPRSNNDIIWVDFPPGAAQTSSTFNGREQSGRIMLSIHIDDASCT